MKIGSVITNASIGIVVSMVLTSVGSASEIKVLSTHAALEVLSELGPQFERATGNTLSFSYDPANAIKREIENGATFDVVLITRSAIDDLTKQAKFFRIHVSTLAAQDSAWQCAKARPSPTSAP